MTKIYRTAACAAALCLLASCSTKRSPLTYFTDIDQPQAIEALASSNATPAAFEPKITADDELLITVTSANPLATAAYNLPVSNPGTRASLPQTSAPQNQTYVVDAKGNVVLPVLGAVHVQGLTCTQIADKILELVSADVQDANVMVRLLNFKVNVAGEVKTPGPQQVTTQRYSVLDALTAAGDLTEYGERNNVLLIREENGHRVAHRLDLNSSDLLTSPYFYLRQNDYIYVEPNKIRQDNSKYNTNNAYKMTVVSTIVSASSVIASLIIALAVKK